jgi:hypothetical protein
VTFRPLLLGKSVIVQRSTFSRIQTLPLTAAAHRWSNYLSEYAAHRKFSIIIRSPPLLTSRV